MAARMTQGTRSPRVERIPAQRQAMILEHLQQSQAASLQELSKSIGASVSTIRRDLDELQARGYLERTHGGAALSSGGRASFEVDSAIAGHIARSEKEAIGRRAAALVEPGQSVIFDSSSTVLEAARAIVARGLPITAVTNDLGIAQLLAASRSVRLIVPGGSLRAGSPTLLGQPGERFLGDLHADLTLLGAHGFDEAVLTETTIDAVSTKRAMIAAAARTLVLADSSKAGIRSFCTICRWSEVDGLITDSALPTERQRALREQGLGIELARPEPSA
ncbi:transcriptional regulator, DeoR family [Tistlia consotensis]|uniref:Transcriptional regulator, DeoR family n=1 Tax=Tistlia consotensis USBA 355 TaxID=560819 RepID=A0A1Y6CKN9_9PROT|nr:DeoR/GlpR family DNA-binding transcription regulator [Tistlia consotensis]SMF69076.1 transcriptional regulator, DeoR family [Tistlia consotensis USBA 355]SNS01750.1 transcriptional regulator, DeoR family [Tistlia consotensis]